MFRLILHPSSCILFSHQDLNSWTPPSWTVRRSFAACCSSFRARAFAGPGEGGISLEEVSRIARQAARVAAAWRSALDRRGGWKHPPRRPVEPGLRRDQGSDRPLHGHDGDRDQRPGSARRDGKGGMRDPSDDDDPHGRGSGAVHPPPGLVPPGEETGGDPGDRDGQSVRHDGYGGGPARQGARRRDLAQGHAR